MLRGAVTNILVESNLKCSNSYLSLICNSKRYKHENHYQILKVPKGCTDKEIRESFVKLSKECHPDISKITNATNTQRFTEIVEAYKILSRPDSRAAYDHHLNRTYHDVDGGQPYRRNAYDNYYEFYRPTGEGQNKTTSDSYYGIKGIRKVANWKIVLILIGVAFTGVALQMFAIIKSVTFRRDDLDKQSALAGSIYSTVRADAEKYGTAEQLRRVQERVNTMYAASNKKSE